ASTTADALVEIHRHAPLMDVALDVFAFEIHAVHRLASLVGVIRMLVDALRTPERTFLGSLVLRDEVRMGFEVEIIRELRGFFVLRLVRLSDDGPAFHRAVFLGYGEFVSGFAGLLQFRPSGEAHGAGGAKFVGVVAAHAIANPARAALRRLLAAIPQRKPE